MWYMGDGWGWWMAFGWLWMVIFWGLIIWAVYTVITRLGGGAGQARTRGEEPSALEILERRYARGELSSDDFEAMQARLTAGGGASQTARGETVAPPPASEARE